jgi:hypothetical protein
VTFACLWLVISFHTGEIERIFFGGTTVIPESSFILKKKPSKFEVTSETVLTLSQVAFQRPQPVACGLIGLEETTTLRRF